MGSFKINDDEITSLYGLPHLQQIIYYRGIRPYMDYATGLVGIKRKISYQSLREEVFVEPHTGYKAATFSRDQVRRAVEGLVRAGVIRSHSEGKTLILECVLATQDNFSQNKAATNPPGQGAIKPHVNPSVITERTADIHKQATTRKRSQAATPPVSGNINNSLSTAVREKISECYQPSGDVLNKAVQKGCTNSRCADQLQRFICYHRSKGTLSFDWDAEFLHWLLRDKAYQESRPRKAQNYSNARRLSVAERIEQANFDILYPGKRRVIDVN